MSHKTALEIMREGGYNPKAGNPVPIELIYQANTISYEEYQKEIERQRLAQQAARNGKAIYDMEVEDELLRDRAIKAGVPKRYLDFAIDLTRIQDLEAGRGIYIFGAQGTHKTTTACSMLRGWLKDNQFGIARFVRATSMLNELKDSFNSKEPIESIMSRYASCSLLVVDDLGKEVATAREVSFLWELFDRRYGEQFPTIVTTQHRPNELAQHIGDGSCIETALSIVSRFRETYALIDMGDKDLR